MTAKTFQEYCKTCKRFSEGYYYSGTGCAFKDRCKISFEAGKRSESEHIADLEQNVEFRKMHNDLLDEEVRELKAKIAKFIYNEGDQ